MWRVARLAVFPLAGAVWLVIGIVAAFRFWFGRGLTIVPPAPLSTTDALTIALAGVTVLLAALAIVLAIAGAVGYVAIRDAARRAAERKADQVARAVAQDVAARTAEATSRLVLPQPDAGDAFAAAMTGRQDDDGQSY